MFLVLTLKNGDKIAKRGISYVTENRQEIVLHYMHGERETYSKSVVKKIGRF